MEKHNSNIFSFDYQLTFDVYKKSLLYFLNEDIKSQCLDKIIESMELNNISIGIDFTKPWEELHLNENYYQIEYLFVGELINSDTHTIEDKEIGINISTEKRFGQKEFNSKQILNLTLIIEKIESC